ncbi:MAG: hypothetical protein J6W28_07565 [Clostridia bacterium]|nr:hypothetical protein [Clostridia bacterium]
MDKVKRFLRRTLLTLRGTSPAALILFGCTILSAAALGIYLLVAPEAATNGTLSPLFTAVRRDDIKEVLVHNEYGVEYVVKSEYGKDAQGNVTEYLSFWLEKDGAQAPLDSEKLSYFVVGTGQNYVYDPVVSAPEEGDPDYEEKLALYERKKKEFGFTDDAPYYVLTKRSDEQKYKVYYGKSALSGDGYYVMLEGRETIYVTSSTFIGDLLNMAGPETLLSPVLYIPSSFQYAYGYPKRFSVYDTVRTKEIGTAVTTDYTSVCFTYLAEDGKTRIEDSILLNNATDADGNEVSPGGLTLALRAFLLTKTVGVFPTPEVFEYTYPDDEATESLRGTTVSFELVSVDALETETERFCLGWNPARHEAETELRRLSEAAEKAEGDEKTAIELQIKALEGELVGYPMYLFSAPTELLPYLAETGTAMTILQNTLEDTGTVVRLGVTGNVINELGLYAHRVSFNYPSTSDYLDDYEVKAYTDANGETKLRDNYLPGEILVSARTENGTRYVASLLSDMVLEVDAALFDYLDEELIYFADSTLQTAPIGEVESMTFVWNYGGDDTLLAGAYRFEITMGYETSSTGEAYETVKSVHVVYPDGTRKEVNHKAFNQLFYRLGYTRYGDVHHLTDAEVAALTGSAENCALGLYYTIRGGGNSFLEFYPIPADENVGNLVLVRTQNGAGGGVGELFTVYGTTLKDIARGFLSVLNGRDLVAADRYS